MRVAIAHDYLTQRGGAERVVLSMHRAFRDAPIYTSLYAPSGTFPEFATADIRVSGINRLPFLRTHHRCALPVLPLAFSRMEVDADVVLVSSSGWAHGIGTTGKKIVYCHTPARWLYQSDRYLGERSRKAALALNVVAPALRRWDRRAARSADYFLGVSRVVVDRISAEYGRTAELLPPPMGVDTEGSRVAIEGIESGFHLCVSRLLPYKNVAQIAQAFLRLPEERLVVVGRGPELNRLRQMASPNIRFLEQVTDEELRWLYAEACDLVAASYEDFGLTPLEAASFGKPAIVMRWGGFLDTVVEGETGLFFDAPTPGEIAAAVKRGRDRVWDSRRLVQHAALFSEARFIERLRELVDQSVIRP
jgi:glycosyltransferase involved in cell wall biosynthesis